MGGFYMLLLTLVAAGSSKANLGEIDKFEVIDRTETTITLEWTLGDSDQNPIKYSLVEDGFISLDLQCVSPCQHTFEFLEPCTAHKFSITPWYMVNGAPQSTTTVELEGTTQGTAPDAPSKLVAMDHNHNADLAWTPPDEVNCLDHWRVCYHIDGTPKKNETCETTNLNSITLHGLDKCAKIIAEISGVTPDGVTGKPLNGHFKMGYGNPSEVRDLVVGLITNATVQLKWNDPLTNPLCVQKYSIDYGPVIDFRTLSPKPLEPKPLEHYDNHATISDLYGCTPYQFDISPLSIEGDQGEIVSVQAETLESYPLEVSDIIVSVDRKTGTLLVTWVPNEKDKCQASWKICYHDEVNLSETCFESDGADGEIFEIPVNLEACTKYDVGISGVTPSGIIGKFKWTSAWSWDEKPGPVQSLTVENAEVNMIEISFIDPVENARCIDRYDIVIDDLGDGQTKSRNTHHDYFFTDLEACTDYEMSVYALTRTNMASPVEKCEATTLEGPMSAPRNFGTHDNEVTQTSINLVWYAPSVNSRCTGSYTLTWTGSSDGSVVVTDNFAYQNIYTVGDLVCGGEYDFTLEVLSLTGQASSDSPVTYHAATLAC